MCREETLRETHWQNGRYFECDADGKVGFLSVCMSVFKNKLGERPRWNARTGIIGAAKSLEILLLVRGDFMKRCETAACLKAFFCIPMQY